MKTKMNKVVMTAMVFSSLSLCVTSFALADYSCTISTLTNQESNAPVPFNITWDNECQKSVVERTVNTLSISECQKSESNTAFRYERTTFSDTDQFTSTVTLQKSSKKDSMEVSLKTFKSATDLDGTKRSSIAISKFEIPSEMKLITAEVIAEGDVVNVSKLRCSLIK